MKKRYIIAELVVNQELCKPSEDYYNPKNWSPEETSLIKVVSKKRDEPIIFETEQEAVQELTKYHSSHFTILPIYIKEE